MKRCLLVIPTFRDAARLAAFLPELRDVFSDMENVRILIVDDGSGEEQVAALRDLLQKHKPRVELLTLATNLGKGGAIYAGWGTARENEEWLAFTDADGATNAWETRRLITLAFESGNDAIIASRINMLGRNITRSLKRHMLGRIFATAASLLTGLQVYDSQCGCKIIRHAAWLAVRPQLFETRFGFDMDLLVNLHRSGAKIIEEPVDWKDIPDSKVSLIVDGWRMFRTLWRLRRH